MPEAADSPDDRRAAFRPEIQALRAIAVLGVLIYHLWPNQLTGGYLGVDVFFVISGFLITSHLLRDSADGRLSLTRFWARRIRRLLPASLTVLLVIALATLVVVPQRLWQQFLGEILASTFYVENWFLAASSVDYLALENDPSAVQHFWSLSAEEQFYIVWPVLMVIALGAWRLVRRSSTSGAEARRVLLFGVLLAITVASFAYAVWATATDPAPAFFASTTRGWEFGAGSLLAFASIASIHGRVREAVRVITAWLGWMGIAVSIFLFSDETPHPGFPTLLPVFATLLVIWSGVSELRLSPTQIAKLRPVQWLGDISYSLYLWHWPLVVLIPLVTRTDLRDLDKLGISFASLALAWGTYRLIEQPALRLPLTTAASTRRWFAAALAAAVLLSVLPVAGLVHSSEANAEEQARAEEVAQENVECLGASAMRSPNFCAAQLRGLAFVPSTTTAADDSNPWTSACVIPRASGTALPCEYTGGTGGGLRVMIVGDSHAAHITSLFLELAERYDWQVTGFFKGGCPFSDARREHDLVLQEACREWNANVVDYAMEHPFDLVVTSQVSGVTFEGGEVASVLGLETQWQRMLDLGAKVIAVKDNPQPVAKIQACLEGAWLEDHSACSKPSAVAFRFDPQVDAAAAFDPELVHLLRFDDLYCVEGACPPVIGAVNVYRDANHLTDTFVRTLVPFAAERIPVSFLRK